MQRLYNVRSPCSGSRRLEIYNYSLVSLFPLSLFLFFRPASHRQSLPTRSRRILDPARHLLSRSRAHVMPCHAGLTAAWSSCSTLPDLTDSSVTTSTSNQQTPTQCRQSPEAHQKQGDLARIGAVTHAAATCQSVPSLLPTSTLSAGPQIRLQVSALQLARQDILPTHFTWKIVVTGTDGEMACGEKLERQLKGSPRDAEKQNQGIWPSKLCCIAWRLSSPSRITGRIPIEGNGEERRKSCPSLLSPARVCALLAPRITSPTQQRAREEERGGACATRVVRP